MALADEVTSEGVIRSRGMVFPKDPEIIHGKVRRLLRTDSYERKETEAALRVVRPGDRVIELGGGIGYMSTLVATKRQVDSVYVIEANPSLVPFIQRVHALNGVTQAKVINGVLGPCSGTTDFFVRSPILGSSLEQQPNEGTENVVRIPILDADEMMRTARANVLICDIEGAEAELIPNLDLSSLRAAVIETHPQWIGPEGMNAVMRAFMEAGLSYYHRGSHGKVLAFRRSW